MIIMDLNLRINLLPIISMKTFSILVVALLTMATNLQAQFVLGNHIDGSEALPYYGLRLDGLIDGSSSKVYTFDFEASTGMYLDYDSVANTIRIHGQVFGGRVATTGNTSTGSYNSSDAVGTWEVDFTYRMNVNPIAFEEDEVKLEVTDHDYANNDGYIKFLSGTSTLAAGTTFDLVDESGTHPFSFRFFDDAHRLPGGTTGILEDDLVGHGWLNHAWADGSGSGGSLNDHIYASDWLFTVTEIPNPIPEPSTVGAMSLAGLLGFLFWKRRRRS